MSKSPKGEASSVALANNEQVQEGNNERFAHTFNSKFVPCVHDRQTSYHCIFSFSDISFSLTVFSKLSLT